MFIINRIGSDGNRQFRGEASTIDIALEDIRSALETLPQDAKIEIIYSPGSEDDILE